MSDAAPAAAPDYTVRPADLGRDRARILELWRSGLGHQGNPEGKLEWYYERNVVHAPDVLLMEECHEAIGVACIAPRRMCLGPQSLDAGVLTDFVVAPERRGFFPALRLQREAREFGLAHYALLFGVPNDQSEAIVKRAGYQRVGEQVRWAVAVRTGAYLARHFPGWAAGLLGGLVDGGKAVLRRFATLFSRRFEGRWIDRPDARFDRLADACRDGRVLMGLRDCRYLDWRFGQSPLRAHRFFALEASHDSLAAYAVCHPRDDVLVVDDFLVDPHLPGAAACLWRALSREAYRMGHRGVSVTVLAPHDTSATLAAAGWVPRERVPVYAAIGPLWSALAAAAWFLTAADIDT